MFSFLRSAQHPLQPRRRIQTFAHTTVERNTPWSTVSFSGRSSTKSEDGGIILQGEGAHNVHERHFPKHNNKGKGHAVMVSVPRSSTETGVGDDLDQVVGQVQHLHKFKHFYDQMDFSLRAATGNHQVESCDLDEGRSRRKGQFDDNAAVFYYNDRRCLLTNHNRPLCDGYCQWSRAQESHARPRIRWV